MFDFFEQPWTLLGIAVLGLFGILTFRSVVPEKRHWWQWLIPVLIVVAAFGTDALVETDMEQIDAVLDIGVKAVEEEDLNAIEAYISNDYRDSFHSSKETLVAHIQSKLPQNIVEKNKKTNSLITISGNEAKVYLFMRATLNQQSSASQIYPISLAQMKIDLNLRKQNNKWLITRIEISKVNQQPVNWNQVR